MLSDDITTGSMKASGPERRRLAEQSLETNMRDPTFRKLFPEYVQQLEERREAQVTSPSPLVPEVSFLTLSVCFLAKQDSCPPLVREESPS